MKQIIPALVLVAAGLYLGWTLDANHQPITATKAGNKQSASLINQHDLAEEPSEDKKAAPEVPPKILTTWTTNSDNGGRLALYTGSSSREVDGFYYLAESNEIQWMADFEFVDNRLEGFWFRPKHTKQKCNAEVNGSFYWGEMILEIHENTFKGKWGLCSNPATKASNGRLS